MSTIFIAVQCFQCSTMQVKQQNKSSNKWTCVVCNEKQSVRKVFAQGFMAKDVRKFVQTFNMSRCQFGQQRTNETLDPVPDQPRSSINDKNRRSDWSEYIDPKDIHDGQEEDEQGNEQRKFDPTTANWASQRFDYKSQSEEGISAVERPRWSLAKGDSNQRTYAKQQVEDGFAESRACHPTTAKVYIIQDDNKDSDGKGPQKSQLRTMKGASKWDSYITEDDEGDLNLKIGREFADHRGKWDDCIVDANLYDQSVEEDIHPEFL